MRCFVFFVPVVSIILTFCACPALGQTLLDVPDSFLTQVEALSLKDLTTGEVVPRDIIKQMLIQPAAGEPIGKLYDNFPAKEAGLTVKDRLIAVDGFLCWGSEERRFMANCRVKADRPVNLVAVRSDWATGEWELIKKTTTFVPYGTGRFILGLECDPAPREAILQNLNTALKDAVRVNQDVPFWAAVEVLPNRVRLALVQGVPETGEPAPWARKSAQFLYDALTQNWPALKAANVETPSAFLNRYQTYCRRLADRRLAGSSALGTDFLGENQTFFVMYHPYPFSDVGQLPTGKPKLPEIPGFENIAGPIQAPTIETMIKQAFALPDKPVPGPEHFMNQVAAACLCPFSHAAWPYRSNLIFYQRGNNPVIKALRQRVAEGSADSDMARLALLGALSTQPNANGEIVRHFKALYDHSPNLAFQGFLIIDHSSNFAKRNTLYAVQRECPDILEAFRENALGKSPLLQRINTQFPDFYDLLLKYSGRQRFIFRPDWMMALYVRNFPGILNRLDFTTP